MITILDYGMGNLGSVMNMFKRIGVKSRISSDIKEIEQAEKLLLPGVGAFDAAMGRINANNFIDVLNFLAHDKKIPVMGICLGMQLLTEGSDEGVLPGLGWIKGRASKFPKSDNLKVPHMGWNLVEPQKDHPLIQNLPPEPRFYFVHSYHVDVTNSEDSILKTSYGVTFDSAIGRENIMGTQFHPEKSHKFGMKILENFAKG